MALRGLVERLSSREPSVRLHAVEELEQLGGREAAGALVLVLGDRDPGVRNRAAEALATVGAEAIDPLHEYLRNWDQPLYPELSRLLGRLRSPRSIELLAGHVADRDPETRAAIAEALGRIGSPEALPALLELLRDLVTRVRIAAAGALGTIGDSRAVEPLLDELADDDPAMRIAACQALGAIGDARSTVPLTRLAGEDPNPDVRTAAEATVRRVSTHDTGPLLRQLASERAAERIAAMNGLLDRGRAAVMPLRDLIRHQNPMVRAAAVEILGAIGDPAAIDSLAVAGRDPDDRVALGAAGALGRIRHPRCSDLLAELLEHDNPSVAGAAANGLERLGEDALDALVRLLGSQRAETRIRVTDVLGRLRHKGSCRRLVAGLRDPTPWVRVVSCQALGEIGEGQAVPELIRALGDRDTLVRAMAAEALGKLADYRATMPLIERLEDGNDIVRVNALRALGTIGNPVVRSCLEAELDSPNPELQVAAIEGLVSLRAADLLPRLSRLARPWPMSRAPRAVRDAARRAVDRLGAIALETGETPPAGG